jgi:hypothetical protein
MIPRAMLAVAYARASHARQVKSDDPDKKGYAGPPGWGLGVRLTTPPHKKYCYETSRGGQGPSRAVEPMMIMIIYVHQFRQLTEESYLLEDHVMKCILCTCIKISTDGSCALDLKIRRLNSATRHDPEQFPATPSSQKSQFLS